MKNARNESFHHLLFHKILLLRIQSSSPKYPTQIALAAPCRRHKPSIKSIIGPCAPWFVWSLVIRGHRWPLSKVKLRHADSKRNKYFNPHRTTRINVLSRAQTARWANQFQVFQTDTRNILTPLDSWGREKLVNCQADNGINPTYEHIRCI